MNVPITHYQGEPVTPNQGAWLALAEELQVDAPPVPVDDPWWVKWLLWPAVFVLTIIACFVSPIWVSP